MISQTDLETINEFLVEANGPLEAIQKAFVRRFSQEYSPYSYFYQGLCDNVFTKGQRLIAIFLLFNSELKACLADVYNFSQNQFEKKFILDPQPVNNYPILIRKFAGLTIKTVLEEADKLTDKPATKEYPNIHVQNKLRNVISVSNQAPSKILGDELIEKLLDQGGFEVDFLRPIPNIINNKSDWIDIYQTFEQIWDYSLQINSDKLSQIKEILQKAHFQSLSEQELKQFQEYFKKDNNNLLKNTGLLNFNLSELIDKNLNLTFFIIAKNYQNPEFQDLMDNLINIDVTPNTLEMMAMIVQQYYVPSEFLNYYVIYCIQYCSNIKEKGTQTKMVRYISWFIKHLIKEKILKYQDLMTELQAFSIEFSKIGETSGLFKLVKQNDQQ